MTRKISRNYYSLGVVAAFVAILTLLIAAAVLAQTSGAGQTTGKANAALAQPGAPAPAHAQLPLSPSTGAGSFPVSRPQTKPHGAHPMDGNPLFLPFIVYDSGGRDAYSVAVGDVNGDGKPDIVVADLCNSSKCNEGRIEVMLGNGDGTFRPAARYPSGGAGTLAVAIADLNGDGKPDLVVANCYSGTVAVLLGNGDGTFQPAATYNASNFSYNVVVADVNGDGKLDVVIAGGFNINVVGVLLGNGDGTLQPVVTYDAGGSPVTVAVADVNLDGRPDIVVANACGGGGGCPNGNVGVLLGNGDGTFQPAVTYGSGGTQPMSVQVADLNGDGKPDVVVSNYMSANVGVLLGNGDGTFQPAVTYATGSAQPFGVAVADVNGDGKPDVVVANFAHEVGVLLGNSEGTFQPAVTYSDWQDGVDFPTWVAIADVNGDGAPDLLVTSYNGGPKGDGSVSVLLNTSGSRTATATALVSSANPAAVNQTVTYTATVTSQSGGTVDGTVIFEDRGWRESPVVAAVTLTGNQAVFSASYTSAKYHRITAEYGGSKGSAGSSANLTEQVETLPFKTVTVASTSGSPSFIGQTVTFTATVTCGTHTIPDGELVTFYDGTAAIGTGTTAGGVATFATSSLTAKTHTIKATYAGDANFKPSTGSVTQVVDKYTTTTTLTSSPNPSQFGQAVAFTATVTSAGPTPTGTVKFMDGTTKLRLAKLNGGVATLTTSKLAVGTHPITAQYVGDADNATSTSAVLDQVVQ